MTVLSPTARRRLAQDHQPGMLLGPGGAVPVRDPPQSMDCTRKAWPESPRNVMHRASMRIKRHHSSFDSITSNWSCALQGLLLARRRRRRHRAVQLDPRSASLTLPRRPTRAAFKDALRVQVQLLHLPGVLQRPGRLQLRGVCRRDVRLQHRDARACGGVRGGAAPDAAGLLPRHQVGAVTTLTAAIPIENAAATVAAIPTENAAAAVAAIPIENAAAAAAVIPIENATATAGSPSTARSGPARRR